MAKEEKKGLAPWMGTFADLCTLLLTFFVLLLTFASMDVQKFKEMLGSVKMAFGVQEDLRGEYQPVKPLTDPQPIRDQVRVAPKSVPSRDMDAQKAEEASRMARQIQKQANAAGMGKTVDISSSAQGVRLRVKGQLLFEPGEAVVKEQAKKLLSGIGKVLNKFNFYLTVEGHSDNQPISTEKFPSNWELSSARASAVLRNLLANGVPPTRVTAVGYAANYPLATNATPEGRSKNRRVEFVFTKRPMRVGVD